MLKRFLFLLLITLLVTNCRYEKATNTSALARIKTLTFTRNANLQDWSALFKTLKTDALKYRFVLSAGQTGQAALFPLLQHIYAETDNDSLRTLAVFSMAQVAPHKSVPFLLQQITKIHQNPKLQKCIISVLGYCADARSIPTLQKLTQDAQLKNAAFYALGRTARAGFLDAQFLRQFFDSTRTIPPTAAEAYYLYSCPLSANRIGKLSFYLKASNKGARLYLLKKINKFLNSNPQKTFLTDSAVVQTLTSFLDQTLNPNERNWHLRLAELKLAANVLHDSSAFAKIRFFLSDSIPYVRLTAFKTLAAINPQNALPLLVDHFSSLPFTAEKAEICKIITSIDPATGYLLINQNLDKGNSYFKNILLNALAETKFPLAIRMLRQFLHVDDPVLIEGAYYALKRIHRLRAVDAQSLLTGKHYSMVALALSDWYATHPAPDKKTLLKLYKTFHHPNQFELQLEIVSILQKQGGVSLAEADTLKKYLAHPFIAHSVFKKLGLSYTPRSFSLNLLPKYLQPDSVQITGHPVVEVITSKGSFRMMLFPEFAPLTVKNFLHLIRQNFYNKLYFHRIVPDFVVQGGDPTGTGWGGCNYLLPSEHSPLRFVRGVVGIATAGFDTGSSQFFICQSDQPHLNGRYTAFAKVVNGMSTVDRLERGDLILTIKQVR